MKWVIFLLLLVGVLIDIISLKLANSSKNTVWLVNAFTFFEFSVLSYFFSQLIPHKKTKNIFLIAFIAFSVFWFVQNFIIGSIHSYDYLSQTIDFLILLLFCLIYFFQKTKISEAVFIYATYEFWLVSALLIYCAGTFFSFFIPMNANERNTDTVVFEYISRVGNIIKSILITVAFCINPDKHSKNQTNPNSIYFIKDLKE